jgi:ribulose-5-phosphate 4-epimerase/fuculose-1-phosphate aldolase
MRRGQPGAAYPAGVLDVLAATVAAAYRSLAASGLVLGAEGNVSVAEHSTSVALVTATGLAAAEASPEAIAVVALGDGRHLQGPLPSSELPTHLALLRAGHGAVVHAHPPHATALGLRWGRVPLVLAELAVRVGGAVPVIPYVPAGSEAMGVAVRDALQAAAVQALVIRQHGVVAVGPSITSALWALTATEEAARVALLAGGDVAALPEIEAAEAARLRAVGGLTPPA